MFRLDGPPENDYPDPGHRGQMTTQAIQPSPDGDSAALTALSEEQRSRVSDALGAAYSDVTRRVYDSLWASWVRWVEDHSVRALPAAPVHVAAYMADRANLGWRPATLRIALAAIAFAHRVDGLDSPTADEGVRTTMRGLVDIAIASVMRDGLLRRSEASGATWEDLTREPDGSGRLLVRRSKTDPEGIGVVLFLSSQTMEDLDAIRTEGTDGGDRIFGLSARQIHRRLRSAARAAGLGENFSGHSARVGMAQDLAQAGIDLPALMTAGRWSSPTMPARYTRAQLAGRGAVARYYGE